MSAHANKKKKQGQDQPQAGAAQPQQSALMLHLQNQKWQQKWNLNKKTNNSASKQKQKQQQYGGKYVSVNVIDLAAERLFIKIDTSLMNVPKPNSQTDLKFRISQLWLWWAEDEDQNLRESRRTLGTITVDNLKNYLWLTRDIPGPCLLIFEVQWDGNEEELDGNDLIAVEEFFSADFAHLVDETNPNGIGNNVNIDIDDGNTPQAQGLLSGEEGDIKNTQHDNGDTSLSSSQSGGINNNLKNANNVNILQEVQYLNKKGPQQKKPKQNKNQLTTAEVMNILKNLNLKKSATKKQLRDWQWQGNNKNGSRRSSQEGNSELQSANTTPQAAQLWQNDNVQSGDAEQRSKSNENEQDVDSVQQEPENEFDEWQHFFENEYEWISNDDNADAQWRDDDFDVDSDFYDDYDYDEHGNMRRWGTHHSNWASGQNQWSSTQSGNSIIDDQDKDNEWIRPEYRVILKRVTFGDCVNISDRPEGLAEEQEHLQWALNWSLWDQQEGQSQNWDNGEEDNNDEDQNQSGYNKLIKSSSMKTKEVFYSYVDWSWLSRKGLGICRAFMFQNELQRVTRFMQMQKSTTGVWPFLSNILVSLGVKQIPALIQAFVESPNTPVEMLNHTNIHTGKSLFMTLCMDYPRSARLLVDLKRSRAEIEAASYSGFAETGDGLDEFQGVQGQQQMSAEAINKLKKAALDLDDIRHYCHTDLVPLKFNNKERGSLASTPRNITADSQVDALQDENSCLVSQSSHALHRVVSLPPSQKILENQQWSSVQIQHQQPQNNFNMQQLPGNLDILYFENEDEQLQYVLNTDALNKHDKFCNSALSCFKQDQTIGLQILKRPDLQHEGINSRNNSGKSAFHHACRMGFKDVALAILQHPLFDMEHVFAIEVSTGKSNVGWSGFELARKNGWRQICSLIEEKTGKTGRGNHI